MAHARVVSTDRPRGCLQGASWQPSSGLSRVAMMSKLPPPADTCRKNEALEFLLLIGLPVCMYAHAWAGRALQPCLGKDAAGGPHTLWSLDLKQPCNAPAHHCSILQTEKYDW